MSGGVHEQAAQPVRKPAGKSPRQDEKCPLCEARPYESHAPDCPWQLWADSKTGSA